MKFVALLLLALAATASAANKCGWKRPSEILKPESLNYQRLTDPDGTGAAGDVLAVMFDFDFNLYQYRIERVTHSGKAEIISFDNGYFNAQNNGNTITGTDDVSGYDAHGATITEVAKKNMLIDAFVAHRDGTQNATLSRKMYNISAYLNAAHGPTDSNPIAHAGFDHRNGGQSDDINTQYNTPQGFVNVFESDYSMVVGSEDAMTTDVMYIVSVRSLRCGTNFYNENYPERGVLLKGIFKLTVNFDIVATDQAVMGTTSMGMKDTFNDDEGNLIFVKHADEVVAAQTKSLSMETFVHDISISGSVSLTGDGNTRECAGESSGGYLPGVTTSDDLEQATATLDDRVNEPCRITGLVEAVHIDSTALSTDPGTTINGSGDEEHNGDDGHASVDSETVGEDMVNYRHDHNLKDSNIVTFLSLAQYVMTGDVPTCTSMLTLSDVQAGKFSPTWFQDPGAGMTFDNGVYKCATPTGFNRTSWTGGQCAANDTSSGCDDIPYIIARHGSGAGKDDQELGELDRDADRAGCTINTALQTLLNSDGTSPFAYNFTCTHGYTQDDNDKTACSTTESPHNDCDRHFTQVVYTPFFGLDGDQAYSPLQYTRMWFGRTTDDFSIESDSDQEDNAEANEFDAVDADSSNGEQTTPAASRRLRGVEKVRKLLKAAPPAVNEMYQQTFHFKVRAPPGKLRHRHRHH